MARISAAVLMLLAAAAAHAQPTMVLGTDVSGYKLFTPAAVVAAGGGGGGGNVPEPPSTGRHLLEVTDGTIEWEGLADALEEELYEELRTAAQGNILTIKRIDPGAETLQLGGITAANMVLTGFPAQSGHGGQCVKVASTVDGWTYGDCGSPRALSNNLPKVEGTAAPGTATDVSRSDHVHPVGGSASLGNTVTTLTDHTSAAGSSRNASREDHRHGLDILDGTLPSALGVASAGSGSRVARNNHVHPTTGLATSTELAAVGTRIDGLRTVPDKDGAAALSAVLAVAGTDNTYDFLGTSAVVLKGLPATTGHAGNVLTVTDNESGVEWAAASGGGGGDSGGSAQITWLESSRINLPNTCPTSALFANATKFFDDLALDAGVYYFTAIGGFQRQTDFTASGGAGVSLTIFGKEEDADSPIVIGNSLGAGLNETGPRTAGTKTLTKGTWDFWVAPSFFGFTACQGHYIETTLQIFKQLAPAGGGGGTTNPTIPKPTAAGALDYLRVNSAGAAYELADFPEYGTASDIQGITSGSAAAGTSSKIARAGHLHNFDSSAYGTEHDIQDVKTGSPVAGDSSRVARANHQHVLSSALYGADIQAVGTASAGGSATTLARSDHVHAGDGHTALYGSTPPPAGVGRPGGASLASRGDHQHPYPDDWTTIIRYVGASVDLEGVQVVNFTTEDDVPEIVDWTADNGTAFVRVTITQGSSVQTCFPNWAAASTSYVIPDANTISQRCSGAGLASRVEYQPAPNAANQGVLINARSNQVLTYSVDVSILYSPHSKGELLAQQSATATNWGNGQTLNLAAAQRIIAVGSRNTGNRWSRLEMEVQYLQTGTPATSHYSMFVFPWPRDRPGESFPTANKLDMESTARFNRAIMWATLTFGPGTPSGSNEAKLFIKGCTWCSGGGQILNMSLWGIR